MAPSPTLRSLTVSAEHDGRDCWIIRWMRSLGSAAPVKAFALSSGPQGRPLPGFRPNTEMTLSANTNWGGVPYCAEDADAPPDLLDNLAH
jgi:hypothetical protein